MSQHTVTLLTTKYGVRLARTTASSLQSTEPGKEVWLHHAPEAYVKRLPENTTQNECHMIAPIALQKCLAVK